MYIELLHKKASQWNTKYAFILHQLFIKGKPDTEKNKYKKIPKEP